MATTIVGTNSDDVIDRNFPGRTAPDSSETIRGLAGRDIIDGYGGNDTVEGGTGNDRIDGGAGNDRLDGGDGDDTVIGGTGKNVLIGGAGNDILRGGTDALDDSFDGGDGDDTFIVENYTQGPIAGGAGYDVIKAAGIDVANVTGVERLEFSGRLTTSVAQFYSFETIESTFDPSGGALITLSSAGTIDFTDRLAGTQLNVTASSAGNTIYGGDLDDHIRGDAGRLVAFGGGGNDTIGGSGADGDELYGGAGDDNLSSGTGDDFLYGEAGNDTIVTFYGSDTVFGGAGSDSFLQVASVEPNGFYGEHYIDAYSKYYGEEGDDSFTIKSTKGGSLLDGGAGRDKLIVDEQTTPEFTSSMAEYDIKDIEILNIQSSVKMKGSQLSLFDELDLSRLGGGSLPKSIYLVGGGVADFTSLKVTNPSELTIYASAEGSLIRAGTLNASIVGSDAGDRIESDAAGVVTAAGGLGNDIYVVDGRDTVREVAGQGNDAVLAKADYVLADGVSVERLYAFDAAATTALNLTGNELGQTLRGNAGNNLLDGKGGTDLLTGYAGNDVYAVDRAEDRVFEARGEGNDTVVATVSYALQAGQEIETLQFARSTGTQALKLTGNEFANTLLGNGGANTLNGLAGSDVLSGRGGADTFTFSTKLGSGNVDRITDFASDDTIKLEDSIFAALAPGELKSSEFKNISTGKADADDHILYKQATGQLFYDADAGGSGAAVWFATLDNKAALTAADILIV